MTRFHGLLQLFPFIIIALLSGCGEDSSPPPTDAVGGGPCPGKSGLGARVTVGSGYVDVCVADDNVVTEFTTNGRYDVTASWTGSNGTTYLIEMLFPHYPYPQTLAITGNLAAATSDTTVAWFYYRETPVGGDGIESVVFTNGTFELTYCDADLTTGQFKDIEMEMQTAGTSNPAGRRTISEGFFSLVVDISY